MDRNAPRPALERYQEYNSRSFLEGRANAHEPERFAERQKAATLAGSGFVEHQLIRRYIWILYTRSSASFFVDSMLIPRFFPAVERNPRTLWACQSVAFMISPRVAPFGRPISSRIFAPLLLARGALASLAQGFFDLDPSTEDTATLIDAALLLKGVLDDLEL